MGQFIPDRDFINEPPTEKKVRDVFVDYDKNISKFEIKNSKAAGVRARNNLLEFYQLCKIRRKEILERKKRLIY